MPQIGWFEILIIAAIAIIVVGPKDFPVVLKKIGSWIGTVKRYISTLQQEVSNLDNEKISLGLFKNLALVNSITLPIGINHITKDISKVCLLNFEESEIIRNTIDFSFENNQNVFDNNNFLDF